MISENIGLGDYVYSQDLVTFDIDGNHSLIFTIISVIISPIRLIMRSVHNIVIMPDTLKLHYYEELLKISAILAAIGLIDLVVYHKWVLIISQIPVILYSLKRIPSLKIIEEKEEVELQEIEIDTKKVEVECNKIFDILDDILQQEEPEPPIEEKPEVSSPIDRRMKRSIDQGRRNLIDFLH